VFKSFFWGSEFQYDDFEFMRMDAIVNEKLNGIPRIVKSYGFCGTGIIGESMINGDLEKLAVPNEVGRFEKPLDDKGQLVVRNNLSGTKKLELSLEMAEAVLLLHYFSGGVIVHDDIQLSQFLISSTGELKLNDFNRAEIMLWNEKDQEYCKYRNNPGAGDVSTIPHTLYYCIHCAVT
jgi:serine/threonine protein kinase